MGRSSCKNITLASYEYVDKQAGNRPGSKRAMGVNQLIHHFQKSRTGENPRNKYCTTCNNIKNTCHFTHVVAKNMEKLFLFSPGLLAECLLPNGYLFWLLAIPSRILF
jgi:hypothetical protein